MHTDKTAFKLGAVRERLNIIFDVASAKSVIANLQIAIRSESENGSGITGEFVVSVEGISVFLD